MSQKKYFLLINLILGSLLLFSYYNGVSRNPEIASQLWGGVPPVLIPYIVSSMFLGAFGYFFFGLILIKHKSSKTEDKPTVYNPATASIQNKLFCVVM